MLRAASDQDGHSLRVVASGHECHVRIPDLDFLDLVCCAQLRGLEIIEVRDDLPASRLGQLLHVGPLDPSDRVEAILCQIVLGEIVDAFLANQDVRA